MVIGVYVAVQTLESYILTPLIQQEEVLLPPALIISAQLCWAFCLVSSAWRSPHLLRHWD